MPNKVPIQSCGQQALMKSNDELNKALKTHISTPYDQTANQLSSHNNRTNVLAPGFINKVFHTENKVHTF